MLKYNATAFLETENILFGLKYEELVANSMSSKNRSKELKDPVSSKKGTISKRHPF